MLLTALVRETRRRQVLRLFLLTDTAPEYFARFGFRHEPIARAPQALKASAEFQGACPASAVFMCLDNQ
jgi:N-acetylglutamate synthase-like GNAT family acetyltransferase